MLSVHMRLKVLMAPVENVTAAEAEVNAFLRGQRVSAVKKEFVTDGENLFSTAQRRELDGTQKANACEWAETGRREA